jgi:hypothetical protein
MFSYIVAFIKRGLAVHMNYLNTEGYDLKSYLIRFWTHDMWIC